MPSIPSCRASALGGSHARQTQRQTFCANPSDQDDGELRVLLAAEAGFLSTYFKL